VSLYVVAVPSSNGLQDSALGEVLWLVLPLGLHAGVGQQLLLHRMVTAHEGAVALRVRVRPVSIGGVLLEGLYVDSVVLQERYFCLRQILEIERIMEDAWVLADERASLREGGNLLAVLLKYFMLVVQSDLLSRVAESWRSTCSRMDTLREARTWMLRLDRFSVVCRLLSIL